LWIHANFDTREIPGAANHRDARLFPWRNRFDTTWGNRHTPVLDRDPGTLSQQILSSFSHPAPNNTDTPKDFSDGIVGWPHNFDSVVPWRLQQTHPHWAGTLRDPRWTEKGIPKETLGQRPMPWEGHPQFCMTEPEVARFVSAKILFLTTPETDSVVWLLPMDSARFCECERCMKTNAPPGTETTPWPADRPGQFSSSNAYYAFVRTVAETIARERPHLRIGALAYSLVSAPPRTPARLPDNVVVDLCHHQHTTSCLPIDATPNASVKENIERWRAKASHLLHYDYVLLRRSRALLPMVRGFVSQAAFLNRVDAQNGGVQGHPEEVLYNPWNFYAYPRAYWNADKLVLRMYRARPVDRRTAPALYGIVEELAGKAGLPMPRVYLIESDQPNAFATGRNPANAAVAATTGLLRRLSRDEVAGVMAHELAHVKNRDTLTMTITATIAPSAYSLQLVSVRGWTSSMKTMSAGAARKAMR